MLPDMRRYVLFAALLPTIAFAEYPSVQLQMKLQEGMTMAEVQKLLGNPDEVSSGTCGAATAHPWRCRSWTFKKSGREFPRFSVTFAESGNGWVLNDWR
jgi:hypothetical protein